MNPELLALVEAFESLKEAETAEGQAKALHEFELRLQRCLERNPRVSRDSLERAVLLAHLRWCQAEDRLRQRRLST